MANPDKKPLVMLIVEEIEKRIKIAVADSPEEAFVKIMCDLLTNAEDLPSDQKTWAYKKLQELASLLTGAGEQRAKNCLLATSIKLMG